MSNPVMSQRHPAPFTTLSGEDEGMPSAATIAARIDRLPATATIWRLVVLLSLGGFFEFYELFSTAAIIPGILKSGILTATTPGFFGVSGVASYIAATFAGLFLGTFIFGFAADRCGRRAVFTYALIWYAIAATVMAFQTDANGLNFWRFMTGLGLGVELVTIDVYLAELVPSHMRGRAFALNQVITYMALPAVGFIAWKLVPMTPFGLDGWRWVVLFGALGAVVVWVIRLGLPESPRWLAAHGQLRRAEEIVAVLEVRVRKESGQVLPKPKPSRPISTERGGFSELWTGKYAPRMLMLVLFHAAQAIGLYGFVNWMPTFLINQGIAVNTSLGYSLTIACIAPLGPLVAMLFADRFERKWQIVTAAIVVAVAGLTFAEVSTGAGIVLCGALVTIGATVMSLNFHAYQSELFPTRTRALAIGIVYSASRVSGALSGFIIAYALAHHGLSGALSVIAACMGIVALSIGLLGPLTRGRSLEELTD